MVDPGESGPIEKTLEEQGLQLKGIYLTHHHYDHVSGVSDLVNRWGCSVHGHIKDEHRLPPCSHWFQEGDFLDMGPFRAKVLFLPGHTLGLVAFYFLNQGWLFSNDLIFSLGCGRVFEGDLGQMYESLNQVAQLPGSTQLMISHEYTQDNLDFGLQLLPKDPPLLQVRDSIEKKTEMGEPTVPTSLDFQLRHNLFFRCQDEGLARSLGLGPRKRGLEVFSYLRLQKDQY